MSEPSQQKSLSVYEAAMKVTKSKILNTTFILYLFVVLLFVLLIQRTICFGSYFIIQQAPFTNLQNHNKDKNHVRRSHPLENSCKYPVLQPEDETIRDFIQHPKVINCSKVQENYLTFDESTSTLIVNQNLAQEVLRTKITCFYRPFAGTLKPDTGKLEPINNWTLIDNEKVQINDDQFETKCHTYDDLKREKEVFRWAFAQIPKGKESHFSSNTETRLSVNMIVLDSTSLNMFRRHMPRTFDYMKHVMKFFHLKGYNKVADNSMVNLLPVLTGKQYLNQSFGNHRLPSDLPENETLDLDAVQFLWNDFAAKKCATMFNDDIMHQSRGVFHYPRSQAQGFLKKPTDFFFRPWHVWHRRFEFENASRFCFGNEPQPKLQLDLIKQFIKMYNKTCHFSFSFFTEVPHDNPAQLELMDDYMRNFLEAYYVGNLLNHTALVIMGDHGHRISGIQYRYVGRIEERSPFFSIYFPKWFRKKHVHIMSNLKKNKHRLTSNYDVYKTLKDIVDERFDGGTRNQASGGLSLADKGLSLFSLIPTNQSCYEAAVPDNHCLCMEPGRVLNNEEVLYKQAVQVVFNMTTTELKRFPFCRPVDAIVVDQITIYSTNQMVQHGIRYFGGEDYKELMNKAISPDIEYLEILYSMVPMNILAKIRLQHSIRLKKLFVNTSPLVLGGHLSEDLCQFGHRIPSFCQC